jgi:hypothetical protein
MKLLDCECSFCGGAISFQYSKVGELINCPECGMETLLFIHGSERPYPQTQYFLQARNIGWARSPLGFRNVVGSVINTSDKNFDWVRIEFTLVTREAKPIGGTSDCLIGFPPKGIWTFNAPVFQDEAVGVGAPLISCEYGKIFVEVHQRELRPAPDAEEKAEPVQATANKPKPANQWTGLKITGGLTGTAHQQPNGN